MFIPSAAAQTTPRLEIADVRIGLPPGRFTLEREENQQASHVQKRNAWAPVYLTLKVNKEVPQQLWVRLEADDADGLKTNIAFPLGNLNRPDQLPAIFQPIELPFIPYVRPSDQGNGEVAVVVADSPSGGRTLAEKRIQQSYRSVDPSSYVVVSLGSKLPGFDLPPDGNAQPTGPGTRGPLRGRVMTAALTNVREMPDQWFGYAAADVVVLATGSASPEFLDELFDRQRSAPFKERREALLEWVRRGGKLVISVGANAGVLLPHEAFQEVLPARLRADEPSRGVKDLPLDWKLAGSTRHVKLAARTDTFPQARLAPDANRPPRVLMPPPPVEGDVAPALAGDQSPVVVQAAYGLGRVTLVTFDLDRSPFLDSGFTDNRASFWDWLLRSAGAERAPVSSGAPANQNYGYGYNPNPEDTFLTRLRERVDDFEGVPVISFGWVALFIALYTLLIGPVEYIFLKKVVGRLELTWVTFPLIVLGVSAAAYFTAYAIKGNDLKLNKIDVVDVDLTGGRVYGRTWFTIFSPRIDSYTIGVEPREGWAVTTPPGQAGPKTLVDWMGGGRGGGGNLVSRGYAYHADTDAARDVADGLVGVPIQVWSTKAFTANWSGHLDPGTPPVESGLYHPVADPKALAGEFVNRLPVKELRDVRLIYAGQAYKVVQDTPLAAGQRVRVVLDPSLADPNWFATAAQLDRLSPAQPSNPWAAQNAQPLKGVTVPLWGALFHEKALTKDKLLMNASLRDLDQSWRADPNYRDQAILVGKAEVPANTEAKQVMTTPDSPSPTRLWHQGLPGGTTPWESIPGTIRQETYVRVFLPVAPRPTK